MNELLQRGPEIPRGSWEYEWVASVVAKTEEYAGRSSHWNGKLYEQAGPVSGIYRDDGSMTISREHVLDPARAVYATDQSPTRDELWAASSATEQAVFQARLSLSEFGDDSAPGATPTGSLEDVALELGLADQFTQEYVGRIGEGLTAHSLPQGRTPAFPAYTAATNRLMYPLAAATGMGVDQLRDLVASTERTQRFTALADRIIDHQLGELVPESHRAQLRQDLAAPLRRGLGGLAMTEYDELTHPGSKARWGEMSAEWTATEFEANLGDILHHYESWNADHPGVEPPGLPTAQHQEIAKLQQFLWSHTAPSRHSGSQTSAGGRPDNVRQIGLARKPDRGVE